ncbi:MAG: signal peptidase I [Drouetiella hepatica Uher 2000/2452]|jgi:signal peptidase I|uniref:Signal peptidase I n=1 Tax=Drouetiella hepatica Uher 2000/2452 TaxID=904376 RepID=A0A951QGE2_9CYAN|nr:signal peptidase I [Drouetiella hepatica Uher 2000/2452]
MSTNPDQNSPSDPGNPFLSSSSESTEQVGGNGTAPKPVHPPPLKPENGWVEAAKTIGLSLILALGIRQFVAEARYIPSESMVPTLVINDRLMVEKITYLFHSPERGDIVVFWPPDNVSEVCQGQPNPNRQKDAFIKRVIGLPGEKVEVRDGKVLINDQELPENYTEEPSRDPWGPQIVPPNSYLMMGDNRNNSCDSRRWGFIPRSEIIGRAAFRFWPIDRIGTLGK